MITTHIAAPSPLVSRPFWHRWRPQQCPLKPDEWVSPRGYRRAARVVSCAFDGVDFRVTYRFATTGKFATTKQPHELRRITPTPLERRQWAITQTLA